VVHQTVSNWVAAHADAVPERPPQPAGPVETAELDELYTYVGQKKRCLRRDRGGSQDALYRELGRRVGAELGGHAGGGRGRGPGAAVLFRWLRHLETLVYYPGRHEVAPGKSQTYSVEADNAELRHYLARLARKSRCFSRSIEALRQAVKLFVHAWNRRQLHKRAFPRYPCHVRDFVGPLC